MFSLLAIFGGAFIISLIGRRAGMPGICIGARKGKRMILYGADLSGPSNKVRFVANYLGLAYEYLRVSLRDGEHRRPEFLRLHPAGKIPVLDDKGFVLFESDAICRYLARRQQSPLYPEEAQAQALVNQWLDFVAQHVGGAMNKIVFNRIFAPRIGAAVDDHAVQEGGVFLKRFLPVLEQQFARQAFLSGAAVSLADMSLLAVLDPAEAAAVDLSTYPALGRWREGLRAEDFYQRCHRSYQDQLRVFDQRKDQKTDPAP